MHQASKERDQEIHRLNAEIEKMTAEHEAFREESLTLLQVRLPGEHNSWLRLLKHLYSWWGTFHKHISIVYTPHYILFGVVGFSGSQRDIIGPNEGKTIVSHACCFNKNFWTMEVPVTVIIIMKPRGTKLLKNDFLAPLWLTPEPLLKRSELPDLHVAIESSNLTANNYHHRKGRTISEN